MKRIVATVPCLNVPGWAVMERQLLEAMDRSVQPMLDKYTREDGTLIWRDPSTGRCSEDDLWESFYNWPLLYLLGGGDHLLPLARRQWDAMTRQLTAFGAAYKEYGRGTDAFHQAEGDMYFYLLCLADPDNPVNVERARRFAGFYLNEDPEAPNYDPQLKLVRAPRSGAGGPAPAFLGREPSYGWSPGMRRYGLPYDDVPGLTHYDDLKDPAKARALGRVMQARMSHGDVAPNLGITSLLTNAYLLTGEDKYRAWVLEYVDAWVERARRNGGLLPDNIGLSGQIGEYIDGKWYGGLYGWTWPHGFYNVGMVAIIAASNAFLVSGDASYLDLPRVQIDRVMAEGVVRPVRGLDMRLREHWVGILGALGAEAQDDQETFAVPYGYRDAGWFDYQPLAPMYPTAVWNISTTTADWERIERLRRADRYDWGKVLSFHTKEDAGHEAPWLRFLAGENPTYPEAILAASYQQVCRRLEQMRQDHADITRVHEPWWQELNPVTTEALIQLTLGAPQALYNGGLLHARVRYFDAERGRAGLPQDVAALVTHLQTDRTVLRLVNISPLQGRDVVIQAGGFAEHRFGAIRYPARKSEYPGEVGGYAAPALVTEVHETPVHDTYVQVHLPPATEIELDMQTDRYVNIPSYRSSWQSA
jgi:hypothetical protein